MFNKYIGKFGKYEAEAVQEILDLHDGDELKARITVYRAYQGWSLPSFIDSPEIFTQAIRALLFAAGPSWWYYGLFLRGLIKQGEQLKKLSQREREE